MKMIPHQAIGMNLPIGLGAGFAQGGDETLAVPVVLEDRLAMIAPIHDMIDRAGILYA